jgi:hypothetical protein
MLHDGKHTFIYHVTDTGSCKTLVSVHVNVAKLTTFSNKYYLRVWISVRVMVFNATLKNISVISWRSVLLKEEPGVPGVNHRPVASH